MQLREAVEYIVVWDGTVISPVVGAFYSLPWFCPIIASQTGSRQHRNDCIVRQWLHNRLTYYH